MSGICHLNITETIEELKTLLNEQTTASSFQKIQALYLFKLAKITTVKDLAVTIGVNRITLQRWLKKYRTQGLKGLLKINHSGGRKPTITPQICASLEQRLNDPNKGFKSYNEIQEWIYQEYHIQASYKSIYATVRYRLKTTLSPH